MKKQTSGASYITAKSLSKDSPTAKHTSETVC